MSSIPGIEGYERSVYRFVESSQALKFHEVCKDFLDALPHVTGRILDAGAGAGQNAAALAKMGYIVTAIEPMADFLAAARNKYSNLPIRWLEDSLPLLEGLGTQQAQFDFILVDGVWHHLDEMERALAIKRFASLLDNGGKCALSLRNGPPGMGTCVYQTDVKQTIKQAIKWGLSCVFRLEDQPSILSNKEDVRWARLVLEKP